jgi:hypothetical protein
MVVGAIVTLVTGGIIWAVSAGNGSEALTPLPGPPQQRTPDPEVVALVRDRTAQATLRNALVAAKTHYVDAGSYADATPDTLVQIEPSLTYGDADAASSGPEDVSVYSGAKTKWAATALSESGACFYIKISEPDITYGSGSGSCTGADANELATEPAFPKPNG